jgi:hypothetical protein
MKTLKHLYYYWIPLAAHCGYFRTVADLLTSSGDAVKAAVATLLPEFNLLLAKEEASVGWINRSEFTAQIAEANREICRVLVGINGTVRIGLHSSSPVTKAAANRIHIMINNYGYIIHKPYNAKRASVHLLLGQFANHYAEDAAIVGLDGWIVELQAVINRFENLLKNRDVVMLNKPDYQTKKVQRSVEKMYQQIVRIINANSTAGTSPDFDALIDRLNPKIERINNAYHRVKKTLGTSDHTIIESIPVQVYTGYPITVIPKVWYREAGKPDVELIFAKDFSITYKYNTAVGMAELFIHGKGRYRGMEKTTFNIVER